jgi:hypothetical protein
MIGKNKNRGPCYKGVKHGRQQTPKRERERERSTFEYAT